MKKTIALVLALVMLVPALFAQGGQEAAPAPAASETVAPVAAAASGSVNAYTTLEEPLAAKLFQLFEEETGIKVNFVRLSGGETVARLEAEASNPQASICWWCRS